jgi:pimeloyl-ACP methyl ester carboxylesterase
VVHGSADPIFPPAHGEAIRDAVPDGRLVVIEGAGHGIPADLWDGFVDALVDHTGRR